MNVTHIHVNIMENVLNCLEEDTLAAAVTAGLATIVTLSSMSVHQKLACMGQYVSTDLNLTVVSVATALLAQIANMT